MNSSTIVRRLSPGSDLLVERVSQYFERHPEVSRENFLRRAIEREVSVRDAQASSQPATQLEIRQHKWLEERLSMLQRERLGWWGRVRRAFGF